MNSRYIWYRVVNYSFMAVSNCKSTERKHTKVLSEPEAICPPSSFLSHRSNLTAIFHKQQTLKLEMRHKVSMSWYGVDTLGLP